MPLMIVRNDITLMEVDAIVDPTNRGLRPTGGADAAIHAKAGKELAQACKAIGNLKPGQAAIADGFALPAKHVIFTVGPRWFGGIQKERETLVSCYRSCLNLAAKHGCKSIAIPLIASGTFGFPKDQALFIAADEIRKWLKLHEMDVFLVVYDRRAFQISQEKYQNIQAFIDQNYVDEHAFLYESACLPSEDFAPQEQRGEGPRRAAQRFERPMAAPSRAKPASRKAPKQLDLTELQQKMKDLDESFSQMLLRKIDESGMSDAQCYKNAGIDRKLFSKIRSDTNYRPSKVTVLAFAISLRLPLEETRDMLRKAGFALSNSSKFDVIVEYFIRNGNYDLFEINEALFAFDQPLIGA